MSVFEAFEAEVGLELPERYRRFFTSGQYRKFSGCVLFDLPRDPEGTGVRVEFLGPRDRPFDLLMENDISRDDYPGWVPLGRLEEQSRFLAADVTSPKCPIGVLVSGDLKVQRLADNLDDFLASLVPDNQADLADLLDRTLGRADVLLEGERFEEAMAVLNGVGSSGAAELSGQYHTLRGRCKRGVGDLDSALTDLERACQLGDKGAALDLLDLLLDDRPDLERALALIVELEAGHLDLQEHFRVLNFKGQLGVLLGEQDVAEGAYRTILERFGSADPGCIETCREDLQNLARSGRDLHRLSAGFLDWLSVPIPKLLPAEGVLRPATGSAGGVQATAVKHDLTCDSHWDPASESQYLVFAEDRSCEGLVSLSPLRGLPDDGEIGEGLTLAQSFPTDAYYQMRTDYLGYEADHILLDFHLPFFGQLLASERLMRFLAAKRFVNLEFLPVAIHDHDGKPCEQAYYLIHPINAQDCLDLAASQPTYNPFDPDTIDELEQVVIDDGRLDPELEVFRIKAFTDEVFIRVELAEELLAQGFSGLAFRSP